jgi:phage terminase large subunit GpA-like protein
MAVKGTDGTDAIVQTPTKVDVSHNGKRVGKLLLWRVGTALVKSELYGWLKLVLPTDEERADGAVTPAGYCHFHDGCGEAFFRELTAQHRVKHRDQRGFVRIVWELIPGRQDHSLDCRVYARAAANVVGIDRAQESDWQQLEKAVGMEPRALTPKSEPPAPPKPASPPPRKKERWVQPRRPGGWLRGDR